MIKNFLWLNFNCTTTTTAKIITDSKLEQKHTHSGSSTSRVFMSQTTITRQADYLVLLIMIIYMFIYTCV